MNTFFFALLLVSLILLFIGFIDPNTSLFWYKNVRNRKKSASIYGGLTILLFLLFGATTENTVAKTDTGVELAQPNKEVVSSVAKDSSLEISLTTKLSNTIKSVDDDEITTSSIATVDDALLVVSVYKAYAMTIDEAKRSDNTDVVKLGHELEAKVVKSQLKNFPIIRKAYYQLIKNKLWGNDVYVDLGGKGGTILKFTGGYFAANANIKQTEETLYDMLELLRFKQTQYRWYKNQDEYTYYKIDSAQDKEILK